MNDSYLVKMSLNYQTKFRLNEINKIKGYFNSEIRESEAISKKLSKYIVVFDYADKIFSTLPASFSTLTIISHSTVVRIPIGLIGVSLTLMSQALIDLDISYEEFKTISNEKEKYEQMKENIRNTKNSRNIRDNYENTEI